MRRVSEQSLPARGSLRKLLGGDLGQGRCGLDSPRVGRQAKVGTADNQVKQISDTTTLAAELYQAGVTPTLLFNPTCQVFGTPARGNNKIGPRRRKRG